MIAGAIPLRRFAATSGVQRPDGADRRLPEGKVCFAGGNPCLAAAADARAGENELAAGHRTDPPEVWSHARRDRPVPIRSMP